MKTITIRELQTSASQIIDKGLPVAIARHGKTIAYLTGDHPDMKEKIIVGQDNVNQKLDLLINEVKKQQFSHTATKLEYCPTHEVYAATCGCEGGDYT